jgi:exodeoxyribonuclease V alpha subunit
MQQTSIVKEHVRGVVERVTFHSETTGWSVLRVRPFTAYGDLVTVTVHQTSVFAGATMRFVGAWTEHPRYGRQFKAVEAVEEKPASSSALQKYLGSGLIKGVGPKTAKRIVRHFGDQTLNVFEEEIGRLMEVPGIAKKKLASITSAWEEHRAIRDVMLFLQSHGISTLFAVRIFKAYGQQAITLVQQNPYRLAVDFFGIGFFTADQVALSLGFAEDSPLRVSAAIRHVLGSSREQGHCYLTQDQISKQVADLLHRDFAGELELFLENMARERQLRVRYLPGESGQSTACYYSNRLYQDEEEVAERLRRMIGPRVIDQKRVDTWLDGYGVSRGIQLSEEQHTAVASIAGQRLSVLTGGPGCGKTTATHALVHLLQAMRLKVLLAAPTGRAAQRMSEVIGMEAKTIHRLLEFQGTRFQRNDTNPLRADFLIVDESSMLDISLLASLLRAMDSQTCLLLIGDRDQLPSVGAGNVLRDIIHSFRVPCYCLTTIFRQARESHIIRYAHQINNGDMVSINSPFKTPDLWKSCDCFFIDSEEATQTQLRFIARVQQHYQAIEQREEMAGIDPYDALKEIQEGSQSLTMPEQFQHVQLDQLVGAGNESERLLAILKKVHPWSSLYYGLTAAQVVQQLYCEWIPKYHPGREVQILTPMIRGSIGSAALNRQIQQAVNPVDEKKAQILVGEKLFRVGDRVIHRKNNYDLNVFNGDIGTITTIDNQGLSAVVSLLPDNREVEYQRDNLTELDLAYAITVHKAQGSEFDVVILPILTQHYKMLFRNLLYTGLTRAKKLAVLVGSRRALAMAIANRASAVRQTMLSELLKVVE